MQKSTLLFQLVSLRNALIKQNNLDKKVKHVEITDFGHGTVNLCNYVAILQPKTLDYLHLVTGTTLIQLAKYHHTYRRYSKYMRNVKANQLFFSSDKKGKMPLTHAEVLLITNKAISRFDYAPVSADVGRQQWRAL